MIYNIHLQDDEEIDPSSDQDGFWIDGLTITQRGGSGLWSWRLPRQQCVSLLRLGNGLARLSIGSYSRTTVTVTGPFEVVHRLRNEVVY